jgi:CubicO group peptidase (beta-lactamase class C family)
VGTTGADVRGSVAAGWEPVRDAFARNFTERGETGAAVAVHHRGRVVADLWGGTRAAGLPWEAGTLAVLRSVTKGVAAVVPLLLHQRGLLDLDAPVAAYWPEFAARGKEDVRVRHLLAHQAGLPAPVRPLTLAEAVDGRTGPRMLAAQAPEWRPGTEHGYHAHTYGWLLGELVARVTGISLGRWFAREVAGPLGLDLWIGLPASERDRVAEAEDVPAPPPPPGSGLRARPRPDVADAYRDPASLTRRAFDAVDFGPGVPAVHDPAFFGAELPASGGIATARALARLHAALTGPVDGTPALFTPATLERARTPVADGPDRVLVVRTLFGAGFLLHAPASPLLGPGSFGHPGRGGPLAFADPATGTGFGYVTRAMQRGVTSDPRAQALVRAVRDCVR